MYICSICKKQFNKSQSLNAHKGHCNKNRDYIKSFRKGWGWNKGKTNKTDERVRKNSINSGLSRKGKHLSSTLKTKLSLARSKYIENGFDKRVKYFKVKDLIVQGGWEKLFAKKFYTEIERGHRIEYIRDNVKRYYTPDFYNRENNIYFEIKGYFPEYKQEQLKLVKEQNKVTVLLVTREYINNLDKYRTLKDLIKELSC